MRNTYLSGIPIYLQIVDQFTHRIVSEEWPAGSRLESVRDLALSHEVNPNTMQRALSQLEKDGLVYTERTSGRYITQDKELILTMKRKLAEEIIDAFIRKMESIGLTSHETLDLLKKRNAEGESNDHR